MGLKLNPTERRARANYFLGGRGTRSPLPAAGWDRDRRSSRCAEHESRGAHLSRQRMRVGRHLGALGLGVCSPAVHHPTPTGTGPGIPLDHASACLKRNPDALTLMGWDGCQRLPIYPTCGRLRSNRSRPPQPRQQPHGLWASSAERRSHHGCWGCPVSNMASRSMPIPSAVGGKPTIRAARSLVTPGLEGRRRTGALLLGLHRRRWSRIDQSLKALAFRADDEHSKRSPSPACCDGARASAEESPRVIQHKGGWHHALLPPSDRMLVEQDDRDAVGRRRHLQAHGGHSRAAAVWPLARSC